MSTRCQILVFTSVALYLAANGCLPPLVPEPSFAWHHFEAQIRPSSQKGRTWLGDEVEVIRQALSVAAHRLGLHEEAKPRTRGLFGEYAGPEYIGRYERTVSRGHRLFLHAYYEPHQGATGTITIDLVQESTQPITDADMLRNRVVWQELRTSLSSVFGERVTERELAKPRP